MNIQNVQRKKRKAISPVLATVILIAITLIAAVAIAGFVFGLFGTFTSSAQISAVNSNILASGANKAKGLTSATCAAAPAANNWVEFTNTGSSTGTLNSISLTYGGQTISVATTPTTGACNVVASGAPVYINLVFTTGGSAPAVVGSQFTGSASASNGGSIGYSGSFQ